MPQLGDIAKGNELGYKRNHIHIWQACEVCGKERWIEFFLFKKGKRRCCPSCRNILYKERYKYLLGQRGEKHNAWKGGYTRSFGYLFIWVDPDDFFAPMRNSTGYVREHRLVMARHLNRCLLPWEVVHHKNSIRDDNKLENLELLPHPRHHLPDSRLRQYAKQLEVENAKLKARIEELECALK